MVERVATHQCRLDEDFQIVDNLVLSRKSAELLRTYAVFVFEIALDISHVSFYSHNQRKDNKKYQKAE
jgi:hypothetical protein